jgi:hypothetical protein
MTTPKGFLTSFLLLATALCAGCKKSEDAVRVDKSAQTPRVRGTVLSITNDTLIVASSTGPVRIAITSPLQVFTRVPSDLAHVNQNSFVGVTSVAQPDGSQQAVEIHIFPESLRGTGEGSYLMEQTSGGGPPSTMTNGNVARTPSTASSSASSRMTNGTVVPATKGDAGPRMTNGTVTAQANPASLTVQYNGGSQTITIPANVVVTELAQTDEKLTPGVTVSVLAKKQRDGTLTANQAILASPTAAVRTP